MQVSKNSVIHLSNVGVRYKRRTGFMRSADFWALHDVSFDLYQGETLGVIGHNGAGKSTLLRLLARILDPDKGTVTSKVDRVSLLSLQVGFVSHLSGRQNAILAGILLGMSHRQMKEKLDSIIAFSELEDFIDEPVRTYSSGMRARLGFAVAFQADPDVILIDEVLGVGDVNFKVKSANAMREKIASDKTVVIVTHSAETVLELCDRVVWVDHGVTRAEGDPVTIVNAYKEAMASSRKQSTK